MSDLLTGVEQLTAKLDDLQAGKTTKKVARAGLNAGLAVVASVQRTSSPVGKTRQLKKAHGKRLKKNRRSGVYEAKAGVNVGKRGSNRAPHGHLVALPTKLRRTRSGASRGRMPGNDWINRATIAARPRALQKMRDKTWQAAKREVTR